MNTVQSPTLEAIAFSSVTVDMDNVGRGGYFTPLKSILGVANSVDMSGWTPTSIILVHGVGKQSSLWTQLHTALIDHCADRDPTKVIVTIGDIGKPVSELLAMCDERAKASKASTAPKALLGNTRVCAVGLVSLFGKQVEGFLIEELPKGLDAESIAVRDNSGHGVSTRLSWPSMLASATKASKKGKIDSETSLGKVLGIPQRGQRQTLHKMVQCFNAGLPFGDCLRITYKAHGKKLDQLLLTPNPVPEILAMLN